MHAGSSADEGLCDSTSRGGMGHRPRSVIGSSTVVLSAKTSSADSDEIAIITINDVDAASPTQDAVLPPVQSSGAAWPQAPADAPWDSV